MTGAPPPTCRSYAAYAVLMGLVLVAGGPQRVSATAYSYIVATGGHLLWGGGFLALGVATWWAGRRSPHALRWALLAGAVASWQLALMFTLAAWAHPTANLTATVAYGLIGWLHLAASERAREAAVWT